MLTTTIDTVQIPNTSGITWLSKSVSTRLVQQLWWADSNKLIRAAALNTSHQAPVNVFQSRGGGGGAKVFMNR